MFVVEVVSPSKPGSDVLLRRTFRRTLGVLLGEPGTDNYDRDYIEKLKEYAARGIPEFWRVDPRRAVVAVVAILSLRSGSYRMAEFRGTDPIVSLAFPNLQLTAEQVLNAG